MTFTLQSQVLKANPEFYAERKDQLFYRFSNGREFRGDPERYATAYLGTPYYTADNTYLFADDTITTADRTPEPM